MQDTARPPVLLVDEIARAGFTPVVRRHPIHFALHRLNAGDLAPRAQPLGQLDHRESDHARIKTQGAAHGGLCGAGRVEAHDEVVTRVVVGLMRLCGFGQKEGAPVRETANHAP